MKKTKPLPQAFVILAKRIVNDTSDGEVGYAAAADTVSENWDQFAEAGATVGDVERINKYLKWAKCEGFCENFPMN